MSLADWMHLALFAALVVAVTKPLGAYLHHVYESPQRPWPRTLGRLEAFLTRLAGRGATGEQSAAAYTRAVLVFSAVCVVVVFAVLRLQAFLPMNGRDLPAVPSALAFNTAASFVTNTNWQSYSGESTMSNGSQMTVLAWQNFVSAAVGMAVAMALGRGLARRTGDGSPDGIGNFWRDLVRGTVHVLLPACVAIALVLVATGVPQTLAAAAAATTVEGAAQTIPLGPVASQEAIKQLGTNGGGFFNANSAHPFENPTPLANLLATFLIFAIPAAMTATWGRMTKSPRQGWALFAAMSVLFVAGLAAMRWSEGQPNPMFAGADIAQTANMEGKEVRFGTTATALFATTTTAASCGAVNGMHASLNPVGGLIALGNMHLGEVVFGGVGAGMYGVLVMALLAVFLAGLMVGRTPEFLGKKLEPREMKLVVLYVLVFPVLVLIPAAWLLVTDAGRASLANAGPHGLSESLYAFTSAAANNGSAFAGFNANTDPINFVMGLTMLAGRFLMIVPALAIAGSMRGKRAQPPGPGTFPTGGATFVLILVAVIVITGALTYFPALCLGPVLEQFAASGGRAWR